MTTGILGITFLVVGFAAMFLMFHLWGYPFDKATKTSSAPKLWMFVHRLLGYIFTALYVVLMWKMVPRLWEYQVEFPARTAIHIVLGFTIGFLLIVKISIVRFFRHFEEWMPVLGTTIMLGTVILTGLSLPFVFQERSLANAAPGGDVLSAQSQARVALLLPTAGLPHDAPVAELSKPASLTSGRDVLLEKCVKCHDLKTILAKPRSPAGWWDTVERMADKPALFSPMTQRDLYDATAYLVAITPDLQRSSKRKRDDLIAREDQMSEALADDATGATEAPGIANTGSGAGSASIGAGSATIGAGSANNGAGSAAIGAGSATTGTASPDTIKPPVKSAAVAKPIDLAKAKVVYIEVCSQCHELSDVDTAPPRSATEVRVLIQRMIKENDATLTADQVKHCNAYMVAHFVTKAL